MPESKRRRSGGERRSSPSGPRRSDIIAAAEELFYEKGFDATTTHDIAERVGMLKGSLYYHIESKEQILLEIIERLHAVYSSNVDAVRHVQGSPLEKIWVFVYRLAIVNALDPIGAGVFFSEYRSLPAKDGARIAGSRADHDRMLRDLLVDGQAEGVVCERLDATLTSTAVLTMCNAIPQWYQAASDITPDVVARSFASLVHSGISCDPDVHPFHVGIDGTAIVPRLHALSLRP